MNDAEQEDKLKNECIKIKEQITPSEELINKTILNVRKAREEHVYKRTRRKQILTKVIGTFTAVVIVAEGATFAFKKQDLISMLFTNVDKGIETAIEYGNIKNVDMNYIEIQDGLKMKVEFVLMNEYNFDLVFKFDGIEEFCEKNGIEKIESIDLANLELVDTNNIPILSPTSSISILKTINYLSVDNNFYTILHCYAPNNNFPTQSIQGIKINIPTIFVNQTNTLHTQLTFQLDFNNINIDNNKTNYNINNLPNFIDNYNIVLSSTNLKVELYLKNEFNITDFDKNKVKLKDTNRNIYFPNDDFNYSNNYILLVFPVSNYQEITNLTLHFTLNNEKQKLKLIKKD